MKKNNKYYKEDKNARLEYHSKYYYENKEVVFKRVSKWAKVTQDKKNISKAKRRATKFTQTPGDKPYNSFILWRPSLSG